jgi:Arc/MetJ-type ribon-helix-helix transcriptional regulator
MKKIRANVPDQLHKQIAVLVEQGWFRDEEDIVNQALRRFLDSHRPELMEKFIREDVEWGLRGGK